MTVAEKLRQLMDLCGTSNRRLAQVLQVDPSLICRFRSGKRRIPAQSGYPRAMAEYFVAKCGDGFRRVALQELIGACGEASDAELTDRLTDWLQQEDVFLPLTQSTPSDRVQPAQTAACFTGGNAWRQALDLFLNAVSGKSSEMLMILQQKPSSAQALLDERLTAAFCNNAGNTQILRILPDCRSLSAVTQGLLAWLPLLLRGNTQFYAYHGLQDDALCMDLILLHRTAALFSIHTAQESEPAVRFTADPAELDALETTFRSYLRLCDPVTETEGYLSKRGYVNELSRDRFIGADLLNIYSSLPYTTTPIHLLRARNDSLAGFRDSAFLCYERMTQWKENAKQHRIVDWFPLFTPEEIADGKAPFTANSICQQRQTAYTLAEYAAHLESVLALMENEPNYCVCLAEADLPVRDFYLTGNRKATFFLQTDGVAHTVFTLQHGPSVQALRRLCERALPCAPEDPDYRAGVMTQLRMHRLAIEQFLISNEES